MIEPTFCTTTFLAGARATAQNFDRNFEVRDRTTGNTVGGIDLILQRLVQLAEKSAEQVPFAG
jgi:hypothetical protein